MRKISRQRKRRALPDSIDPKGVDLSEVILEYVPVGKSVKVSAIDTKSLTEVSIIGSVYANKSDLELVAVRKLIYVMRRRKKISVGSESSAKRLQKESERR